MSWDTLQQLIRIGLYAGGSAWLGAGVADGALFQGAIGGVLAIGAFVWWMVVEGGKAKR